MYASIHDHYMMAQVNNQITLKNNLLCNITRAIQSVQQFYVQKEAALTNSDCQAHELCQQFDNIFMFGLKRVNESYFKVVIEFTHKDVISEINGLLNVTTFFGKARAWLYHALNDNLLESYLKCFLDHQRVLLRYYQKESLIADEQTLTVLVTLVSGLENVQFKLFSDVPYLDHSCWPTHLYLKRDLIQQKLEILNQQDPKLNVNTAAAVSSSNDNTQTKSSSNRKPRSKNKKYVNNVSLDSNSSTNFSDLYSNDMANESETSINQINKLKLKDQNSKNRTTSDLESNLTESIDASHYTSLSNSIKNKQRTKASSSSSVTSSEEIISSSATSSNFKAKDFNKSFEIDREINKLREVAAATNAITFSPPKSFNEQMIMRKPSSISFSSTTNQDLGNVSPTKFDKRIQELENYSTIIADATSKMDECVKSMTEVYQSYDENRIYFESPVNDDAMTVNSNSNATSIQTPPTTATIGDEHEYEKSLYDIYKADDKLVATNTDTKESTQKENNVDTLTSFDEKLKFDLKQEIKLDNNTKLMLLMNIFQNDQNEELIKMYHVTRGHSKGEIDEVFLLITSYAIYVLIRNESSNDIFKKEATINHNEIDYIEVSLNSQAFHIVCVNRRKNYWFTTASKTLTDAILTNLQISRERSNLKLPLLSILKDSTTQKIAIKKFIANNENISPQDFDIKSYSLVFWEDQASAATPLIHKEGYLLYFTKSASNFTGNNNQEWKKAYFVLKNDVLSQFRDQTDKRAHHIIKLNGEDFSGCRKSSNSNKPFTIELILSNSTTLYLAAKSETEASDWLQAFCKTISLGNRNTDVPINSCLPCCSIITNKKLYYCHEDLNTNFYRLLEVVNLQEITKISYDQTSLNFCVIHLEAENKKQKYWFVYFVDEIERNSFINSLKSTWDALFEVNLIIEVLINKELLKRCQYGLDLIHNTWQNYSIKKE